jgi:uncharacterized protein (DUF2267 family)
MFETRKKFLQEVMWRAGLKSLDEADRVAQVVIGLIKTCIGPELSEKVAEAVPPDLAKGWTAIALPSEVMELQEIMFELDEVGEEPASPKESVRPEYG